jgi:hypothetical protein
MSALLCRRAGFPDHCAAGLSPLPPQGVSVGHFFDKIHCIFPAFVCVVMPYRASLPIGKTLANFIFTATHHLPFIKQALSAGLHRPGVF